MYASVTNIIPDLVDKTRISGRILLILSAFIIVIIPKKKKIEAFIVVLHNLFILGWLSFDLSMLLWLNYLFLGIIFRSIPSLTENAEIVDRDKKMVEKFDFDPTKTSAVEICSTLWKLMDLWKHTVFELHITVVSWVNMHKPFWMPWTMILCQPAQLY